MSNGDFIAGDTFSNNNKPDTAPNAFDFNLLNKSIDQLKNLDIKTVYPGHGTPFEFKAFKRDGSF
jgi:glyoxylase-like metal-dependent hydrolase (beta-lactamase superfamily II)